MLLNSPAFIWPEITGKGMLMLNIQLKDSQLLNDILRLLVAEIGEGMLLNKEMLEDNPDYQAAVSRVKTIERILREIPGADAMLEEYIEATIEENILYSEAAFLKGVKTGFNLLNYVSEHKEDMRNGKQDN